MKTTNLVIGAGLSGIVIAQKLSAKGEDVLIIEKRNHIGGNCFDYYDENGILIHKYGPHIFHTNFSEVWDYLNNFSEFTNYQHKVLGYIDGNLLSIPFNFNSLYSSFSPNYAKIMEETLLKYFEYGSKVSISELKEKSTKENNAELNFLANFIYEKIFKNYTIKQWGISVEDISNEVIKRVPILISRDDRYFPQNKHQGMPKNGYSKMFEKMLNNKNIRLMLCTDYKDIISDIDYKKIFVTGPIDEFFDYKYGKLDYRNTLFKFETYDKNEFQKSTVINYPNDYEYTRITEFKKFYPINPNNKLEKTVICKEIPGIGEINAYPVENKVNLDILGKYLMESKNNKNTYFFGRLANFKYFDMDMTIKNILDSNI